MKKYIPLMLCTALLCACADTEKTPSSLAESSAQETTVATDATEAQTTESKTEATTKNEQGKLFCLYSKTGLTLKMDGVEKNFVELQQVPNAQQTVIADFNFDGYEDIFIPRLEEDPLGFYGDYWVFSPDEDSFVISDELAIADGMGYVLDIYQHNQLISVEYNSYGKIVNLFEWQDDELIQLYSEDYYYSGSEDIIDRYEFDDMGEKILVSRTFVNPSNGAKYKTVDNPVYFKVTDTTVDYMKGRDIIQQVDNHNLPQLYNELADYVENYTAPTNTPIANTPQIFEIEKYLGQYDFDFDGYNDLAIPTDFTYINGKNTSVYYRYDPQTDRFVPWKELNSIGHTLNIFDDFYSDEQYVYAYAGSYKDDELYYYEYRWFGDNLKLTKKHIYYNNSNIADVITYDENGNEISRKTTNYIRDDFTQ
ncbi:MAG: hypothetical protein E7500_05450 [Ruminococcus sp.]|nr:hypothetical protein [Ruminococcus sp.]